MNGVVRRWTGPMLGTVVAAAGLAFVAPAAPAFACGAAPTSTASGAAGASPAATATGSGAVRVSGPEAVTVPAGGTGTFAVTVANNGVGFRGSLALRVNTSDATGLPATTMEVAGSRGDAKTWRMLAAEGAAGSRWYAVDGVGFHAGEVTTEFRLGVAADARGARLRITTHVRDAAGRLVGTTTADATVVDAALRVRTTLPAELRRGDAGREFDVWVHNPSARVYRAVTVSLALTGLGPEPVRPGAGHLVASDIRLERAAGSGWERLDVRTGCDPTYFAQLSRPFELAAGESRTLRLRIGLADSAATAPHPAHYWVSAVESRNVDSLVEVAGDLLIRPHRLVGAAPTPQPVVPAASAAPANRPVPTASAEPAATQPVALPDSGPPIWPFALGSVLLVTAGTALTEAVRRRRG